MACMVTAVVMKSSEMISFPQMQALAYQEGHPSALADRSGVYDVMLLALRCNLSSQSVQGVFGLPLSNASNGNVWRKLSAIIQVTATELWKVTTTAT